MVNVCGTYTCARARSVGALAGEVVEASSAEEVAQELLGCYALIERIGRGAVYFGSARQAAASPYWERSVQLAEQARNSPRSAFACRRAHASCL